MKPKLWCSNQQSVGSNPSQDFCIIEQETLPQLLCSVRLDVVEKYNTNSIYKKTSKGIIAVTV